MDFRELSYVLTVADCRSVTAAAKRLYISQPSLSYILSKVEQDVGVKLFDRKTSPITLTYAGEKYVETARKILSMKDKLRRELMDIGAGVRGEIHIGISTERAGYMLPQVASLFHSAFPKVEIRLQEAKSAEILDDLVNDRVAIAVLPGGREGLPVGMAAELVYRERLLLVAGEGVIQPDMLEPASGEENGEEEELPRVRLSRLGELPFIMFRKGQYIRRTTDRLLHNAGIMPRMAMELSSCMSAAQIAGSGLGLTIVPERAVDALGGRKHFPCYTFPEQPAAWEVNAVYKDDAYLDKAERYFIDLMKEVFERLHVEAGGTGELEQKARTGEGEEGK